MLSIDPDDDDEEEKPSTAPTPMGSAPASVAPSLAPDGDAPPPSVKPEGNNAPVVIADDISNPAPPSASVSPLSLLSLSLYSSLIPLYAWPFAGYFNPQPARLPHWWPLLQLRPGDVTRLCLHPLLRQQQQS